MYAYTLELDFEGPADDTPEIGALRTRIERYNRTVDPRPRWLAILDVASALFFMETDEHLRPGAMGLALSHKMLVDHEQSRRARDLDAEVAELRNLLAAVAPTAYQQFCKTWRRPVTGRSDV